MLNFIIFHFLYHVLGFLANIISRWSRWLLATISRKAVDFNRNQLSSLNAVLLTTFSTFSTEFYCWTVISPLNETYVFCLIQFISSPNQANHWLFVQFKRLHRDDAQEKSHRKPETDNVNDLRSVCLSTATSATEWQNNGYRWRQRKSRQKEALQGKR